MEYRQLNLSDFETRFLRILYVGDTFPRVRCEVVTASLTKAPKFTALSYTWGAEPATEEIRIDGQSVLITRNAEAALVGLDSPLGSLIWIDAICINQNDLFEKSYQVSIMGEIYARATTVVAWLGMADDDTEKGIDLLHSVSNILSHERTLDDGIEKKALAGALRTSSDPPRALRGLLNLLTRPFWERVWIIQEIAKARVVSIRCGRFATTLEPIWRVYNSLPQLRQREKELLAAIRRFRSQQQNPHLSGIGLLEAICVTKGSQASDPRDRVFALLGLTTDGRDIVPLPDYRSPLTTVFSEVSARFLTKQRQLAVMVFGCRTRNSWNTESLNSPSLLTTNWTELHDYVPEWVLLSALQPEKTSSDFTLEVKRKHIVISANYVGTIVDCELDAVDGATSRTSIQETEEAPDESRQARISDTINAYKEDIKHLLSEVESDKRYNKKEKNATQLLGLSQNKSGTLLPTLLPATTPTSSPTHYDLSKFSRYLRGRRTEDRHAATHNRPLDSPLQRLGRLKYRGRKIWSLAALHEKEHSARAHETEANSSSWDKIQTITERIAVYGMIFGTVEREPSMNVEDQATAGAVYSGLGLFYKEAKADDMLFQLPGLRYVVILRRVEDNLYRLVGDGIFRSRPIWTTNKINRQAKKIRIEI